MDSTLVIKAKCGDTLRRFNVPINENGQLDLDMTGLRAKILGLFNFPPDTDVILTYVDEDGDVVTLVDDDDLIDVMRQSLKFLRIDVQLKNDKFAKSSTKSSACSTPLRSPRVQSPALNFNINSGIAEVLKTMPEPLRETISKLSLDLTSKAACSNAVVAELVDCFSKMGQSFLNPAQQSHGGASSSTHAGSVQNPVTPGVSMVPNAADQKSSPEVRVENVTRGVGAPPIIPFSTPVDLNLDPPCDPRPSGCTTNNFKPTIKGGDKVETKKQNVGNPSKTFVGIGSPSNPSDLIRPFGNECPFGGIPVTNDSSASHFTLPRIHPFRRSCSRNDPMVGLFHRGVQCDGCGVHPITGPRYKSKVKEDYDLCSICFSDMGNEADYMKIDRPLSYRPPRPFKGYHDSNFWAGHPSMHVMRQWGTKAARGKLDSRFILDVNVLDGTIMAPSTHFTKIWRMRNNGSVAWPQGARLVWIGGDRFSHSNSVELEIPADGIPVDGELDIAADFTSPELSGRYLSYWRLASPSGTKFGQRVWVLIHVEASLRDPVSDGVRGLNLNFPPDCSGPRDPEFVDVNVQPVTENGILVPQNTTSTSVFLPHPLKPMVDVVEQTEEDQELNFPTNDSLLGGSGVSTPAPRQAYPSALYPIIDLSEAGPSEAVPAVDAPALPEEADAKDVIEKSLLKELEEMGFRQVDLNKEILRMNEYNLEQSVDDLCGVSDWDPILEELNEMGFRNEEMNKKLLKKNKGSIKGVVMDLLTGEKA